MKLTRLYSNKSEVMSPLVFNDGLSVVLAEIRVPANMDLDTHNLGKTTVGELIDFMLLKAKRGSFFLFKHEEQFADFDFYLEIQLGDGTFLTVRRPVTPGSRIWFLKSETSIQDATAMPLESWAHRNVAFDRARVLLNSYLDIGVLSPWNYRKLVGYLVRSQVDYQDVFQLGKFSGKHVDWKPFVAHLLGMSSGSVLDLYLKREQLERSDAHLKAVLQDLGGIQADLSVIDGLIAVKRREVQAKGAVLESFNFDGEDREVTRALVEDLETSIAALNERSYQLSQLNQRIAQSLEEQQILFSPDESEKLFTEAGVLFPTMLKKSYSQLIEFNRAITEERRTALSAQLESSIGELRGVRDALEDLNGRRASAMSFLRESDSLIKFKELSRELTTIQAELSVLESRRDAAARLQELRQQHRALVDEFGQLETVVEAELDAISGDDTSRFGRLREYFSQIVFDVLGQSAILAIKLNSSGGIDFSAEFVNETGTATSGGKGTSYKKLLCIAFDLAMLRAYLDVNFPRFVYHDGALEQLEPRKRENLVRVLRQYAGFGLQPVISALDSDLPEPIDSSPESIHSADVIALLHDEGEEGRLFRMPSW